MFVTAAGWGSGRALRWSALALLVATSQAWGLCTGGACSAPGAGRLDPDCITEYDGVVLNYPTSHPRNVVCTDGDPSCDADATANVQCRFDITVCLNNPDPRFPACTGTDVVGFEVKNRAP